RLPEGDARAGLRPELVPRVEVLEMLPPVGDPTVCELEDDAVGDVEMPAVPVRGAPMDPDDATVAVGGQRLQLGLEGPSGLLRQPAEVRQGRIAPLVVL